MVGYYLVQSYFSFLYNIYFLYKCARETGWPLATPLLSAEICQRFATCTGWHVPCGENTPKSCLGRTKHASSTVCNTKLVWFQKRTWHEGENVHWPKKTGYHFHIKFTQICCKNGMARNFCAVNFAKESNMDARTLGAQLSSNIYPHCMKQDAAHELECRHEEHFVKYSLDSKCFPSYRTSSL